MAAAALAALLLAAGARAAEDPGAEGTCDAVTGKCAGLEYASDPPCYFPTTWLEVPVKAVRADTHNSRVVTFEIPGGSPLNLPVSSALLLNAPGVGPGGKDKMAPYNPISDGRVHGSFDLLVKAYPEGTVSKFVHDLKPGDRVAFKQQKPQVKKFQYPFGKTHITMAAGGTGIAPMIQALYPLLKTPSDTTKVRLLYSNLAPRDIMLKAELDQLAAEHADRLEVTYIVGSSPTDTSAKEEHGWTGETGWIDEEKIRRIAFPPGEGVAIWICGVDDMYKSLAGSRMKAIPADAVLSRIGYTADMVWRS